MRSRQKDIFWNKGFPSHDVSDEDKNKDDFGLQWAKAIEYEWFYRKGTNMCPYYDKRQNFHRLRLYARGEQDTNLYKQLIAGGEESSYANYDWRPIQVAPKFMKLITNQMSERLFEVRAEAIDNYSTDLKDKYRESLENLVYAKPIYEEAKKVFNIDVKPTGGIDEYPDSIEEIDLHMRLKYKPAIEIATEEALKYTLDLNDYKEIQAKIIEDIASIGVGGLKHTTDDTKGIVVEYVDVADCVYSFPEHKNFKDVYYYGEVKRISINELKRISKREFTADEIKSFSKSANDWNSYHGYQSNTVTNREGDLDNFQVDVLFFNFKSTKTLSYKKKFNKNGGFKMIKKESTFDNVNENENFEAVRKVIDVWYEGCLVLGTEYIFNYKVSENMVRPDGNLHRTLPNYIFYSPDVYQGRFTSLLERIIPYIDQMQQIHIKTQQMIAKARPNGIYIDVAGLDEIALGEGNVLTPLEAVKIYDETGNVLGTSITREGDYNYGREPIKELKNGVIDGLDRLINAYNHYLNLVRDAIGIPIGADASMPHPDTLVGVQKQVATNSNTATRHVLDSVLDITERTAKALVLRLKDIFKYSDMKQAYINAIGKINVKHLEALKQFHLHDLGIIIELKPDVEEKQYLEANIQMALSKDSITFDDANDVRKINNIKLANELLKIRRIKREKEKKEFEMQMQQLRDNGQAMIAERSAQAEMMKNQEKTKGELAVIQAKTQGKKEELTHEGFVKSGLMKQEFEYNMILAGQQEAVQSSKLKYQEDRKDSRQAQQNTQDSQKIAQRQFNLPPKKFESSEDNVSGNIDLDEMSPS